MAELLQGDTLRSIWTVNWIYFNSDICRCLLKYFKYDPNTRRESPRLPTYLHVAINTACRMQTGKDRVELLLADPRTDLNVQNITGQTVLILAIEGRCNPEIIDLLLEDSRTNIYLKDMDGKTAMDLVRSDDFSTKQVFGKHGIKV